MYITIDERDQRPLYQQIVDEIKGLIARGELAEGLLFHRCARSRRTWV